MRLMVGLGNPGAQYQGNRHNVGFMALDRIAADHGFAPWRARFQGLVAEGRLGSERVALLKPQGFMNLSGQSVGEAMRYLKLTPAEVIVLHDELDLPPGRCRVKAGGGHAGHNGLRSIHQHIGEGYRRLRIGIGHPGHKDRVTGHVLSDFAKAEQGMLDDVLRGISDGAAALAAGEDARFGDALAARLRRDEPPRRPAGPPAAAAPPAATPAATAPAPGVAPDPQPAASSMGDRLRSLRDRFR